MGTNVLRLARLHQDELRRAWNLCLGERPDEENDANRLEMVLKYCSEAAGLQESLPLEEALRVESHIWRSCLDGIRQIKVHRVAEMLTVPFFGQSSASGIGSYLNFVNHIRGLPLPPLLEGRRLCEVEGEILFDSDVERKMAVVPQCAAQGGRICKLGSESRLFVFRPAQRGESLGQNGWKWPFAVLGICYCSININFSEDLFVLQ
jgi:hypothetical protein